MEPPKIDTPAFRTLVQDLFLLPDLPEDNNDTPFIYDLPTLLEHALKTCEGLFPEDCTARLRQCRTSISNFLDARAKTNQIQEQSVLKLLKKNSAGTSFVFCQWALLTTSSRHSLVPATS